MLMNRMQMSAGDVGRCRPMADGGANWWPFEDKPVEMVPSPTFAIFRKNRRKVKVTMAAVILTFSAE